MTFTHAGHKLEGMEANTEKVKLGDQYKMIGFDPKLKIAKFCNLEIMPNRSAFFYMGLPEKLSTKYQVDDWLKQEGEDGGWEDVNIKYKLLQKARKWKETQDGYGPDHPQVSLENANAQEKYNLTVLAEQGRLMNEFENSTHN